MDLIEPVKLDISDEVRILPVVVGGGGGGGNGVAFVKLWRTVPIVPLSAFAIECGQLATKYIDFPDRLGGVFCSRASGLPPVVVSRCG